MMLVLSPCWRGLHGSDAEVKAAAVPCRGRIDRPEIGMGTHLGHVNQQPSSDLQPSAKAEA